MSEKILKDKITELEEKIRQLEKELISSSHNIPGESVKAESESRLRRAELASHSGNWELHIDTGKMNGSEGAMKLYGLDKEEFNYEDVKGIPLVEYRPLLDVALKELLEENKPYDIEFRIRNARTGKISDIHSTAEYNSETKTVFGVIQDITDQKITEELIRRKNRDLGILLDVTMELLEKPDRKMVLNSLLEASNLIVGLDTGAVYTVDDHKLFLISTIPQLPGNFPDEFRLADLKNHPHIEKTLEHGSPLIIPDVDGTTFTPEENLIVTTRGMKSLLFIPLIASGQNLGIIILGTVNRLHKFEEHEIAICRTISNIASLALENSQLISNLKTARDKAEESDKLKTAFLHNISHEIRTPLNAIVGFTGFLDQPDLQPEERSRFMDIIFRSSNQLLTIMNDIFNVSQIEAGQVILREDKTDIREVLNNVYTLYVQEAERKGIDYRLVTDKIPENNYRILCDEGKLVQILTNLIGNAFKFTTAGYIIIECFPQNGFLVFRVEDSGIGIEKTEHENIFKRFYQVDKAVTREYSGTGLGLAISEAYIKLMGGTISVESDVSKGSLFTFTIPARTLPGEEYNLNEESIPLVKEKSVNPVILVAEDEHSNYQLLEYMLQKSDFRLLHAANGLEAVEICRSDQRIDLVLMDIKMPVMDGFTATREIKKVRPGLHVVAQTAYADQKDKQKAFESGCSDFLAKPFSKAQLLSLIGKYLPV
jgi:signal transduction histidine kinase